MKQSIKKNLAPMKMSHNLNTSTFALKEPLKGQESLWEHRLLNRLRNNRMYLHLGQLG